MKKKRSKRRTTNEEKICAVIESSLDSWSKVSAATTKPAPLNKRWSIEEPEAILDYLHGDTPALEVKACCYYEHARASEIFRKARREYDRAYVRGSSKRFRRARRGYDGAHEVALNTIVVNFPAFRGDWRRTQILICPDYPKLPWRELTEAQRKDIVLHFVRARPTPLITNAWMLNALRIFDRFKEQAEAAARECRKRMIRVGDCPATVGDGEIKHVVVTVNYREGVVAVKKSFSNWLDSEANKNLFKKYHKAPVHRQNLDSPDRYKELLKYLAAWRLYDELGPKKAAEWTKTNRRQCPDASGIIRVKGFFREKQSKRKHGPMLVETPLYKERRQWDDAMARAQSFLAKEIECGSGMT